VVSVTALEALRADVEQVTRTHEYAATGVLTEGDCMGCEWRGTKRSHAAHVSERVMVMLVERWGLHESHSEHVSRATGERVVTQEHRLVTDWRTDDTARERDDE
jgi:hypothetical protein